jgi:signal peptidase I
VARGNEVRYEARHAAAPRPSMPPAVIAVRSVRLVLTGLVMTACTAVLSLFVWTLLPMAVGWSPSVVLTGSMLPAIQPGDIVVTAPAGDKPAAVGHVLRFVDPSRPSRHLMHRVIRINDDGTYVTRGDANPSRDSTPVPQANVTGVARLRIPLVGLPVVWLREGEYLPLGLTVVGMLAGAQLLAGLRLPVEEDEEEPSPRVSADPPVRGRHRRTSPAPTPGRRGNLGTWSSPSGRHHRSDARGASVARPAPIVQADREPVAAG